MIERFLDGQVSDTTLRTRRDESIANGVFLQLLAHAIHAYQFTVGYDLNSVIIDGCNNDAIASEGTGFNPEHPGEQGWKSVISIDATGSPVSLTTNPANRQDNPMTFDALDDLKARDKLRLTGTLHADRGFDCDQTPGRLADDYDLHDLRAPKRNAHR